MLIHSAHWTDIRLLVFDNDVDDQVHMLTVDQLYWLVYFVICNTSKDYVWNIFLLLCRRAKWSRDLRIGLWVRIESWIELGVKIRMESSNWIFSTPMNINY